MKEPFEIHITLQRVEAKRLSELVALVGSDWRVGDLVLMDDSFDSDGKSAIKTLLNAKERTFLSAQAKLGITANILLDEGFTIQRLKIEEIISDSKSGDYQDLLSA